MQDNKFRQTLSRPHVARFGNIRKTMIHNAILVRIMDVFIKKGLAGMVNACQSWTEQGEMLECILARIHDDMADELSSIDIEEAKRIIAAHPMYINNIFVPQSTSDLLSITKKQVFPEPARKQHVDIADIARLFNGNLVCNTRLGLMLTTFYLYLHDSDPVEEPLMKQYSRFLRDAYISKQNSLTVSNIPVTILDAFMHDGDEVAYLETGKCIPTSMAPNLKPGMKVCCDHFGEIHVQSGNGKLGLATKNASSILRHYIRRRYAKYSDRNNRYNKIVQV